MKIALEESLYTQVVRICRKIMFQKKKLGKHLKENTCFKDSLQDRSIDLILILSGLNKISVQENLSFTRGFFKAILKVKLDQNILHLLFLLEMKKKQVKFNNILNLQWWNIIKNIQTVVTSVV